MSKDQHALVHKGDMKGHGGWVTAIATGQDVVISASRDKSLIVWKIERDDVAGSYGVPHKRFVGHNHFVQDVNLTVGKDTHAVSASWDGSVRLWDLSNGSSKRFVGHSGDVLSVVFSPDNRRVISGARDKTIKLWNILGQCKKTFPKLHRDWVSAVRCTPAGNGKDSQVVSASWDHTIKVWSPLDSNKMSVIHTLGEHTGYLNTISLSPDGSLCASGGKDGVVMLWDINEGNNLTSHNGGDVVNALAFSPIHYWICIAMPSKIVIWDLVAKQVLDEIVLAEQPKGKMATPIQCVSVAWSADGSVLYAGYTDNTIRVYEVESKSE